MGCEGCLISPGGMVAALNDARQQAIIYARQTKQTVAIWREGFEFFYGEIGQAIAAGQVVIEVVSENY